MKRLDSNDLSRRSLLRWGGAGFSALALGGFARVMAADKVDVHIRLFASPATVQILGSGNPTDVYQFTARLIKGPKGTIQQIPGSHIGPTLHLRTGQRVRIEFVNNLAEVTVVHFHGLHVPMAADGHPINSVDPGGVYNHEFTVLNQAGTYWYHAHTDMRTGFQVYRGLYGMIVVHDSVDDSLGLPRGLCDVPVVIQDVRFNGFNWLVHSTGSQTGHLGDKILINGKYATTFSAATRCYRFRLLNGSNSRIYKLAWDNGMPMTVIGTDGGLLPHPIEKPYLMLSPGERRDVYVDFSDMPKGTVVKLLSLAYEHGGPGSGFPIQGSPMELWRISIDRLEDGYANLPSTLRPMPQWDKASAVNNGNSRVFALEYMGGWSINGRMFELTGYEEDEIVVLNQLELWEIRNDLATGTVQPHPIHFHGPQFQIASRITEVDDPWYDTIRDGYVDEGWHDTILAFPGERIEFLTKWTHFTGLFLYHCHNLEHEDMGMMRNLFVRP